MSYQRNFTSPWKDIAAVCKELTDLFHIEIVTVTTIASAIEFAERYNYSYYDSLILASGLEGGCSVLYSEDFQHGQVIDGLTIINPFLPEK